MLVIFLIIFLYMIRNYIVVLIMGFIFAALLTPLYLRLVRSFKGKRSLSAIIVTLGFLLVVMIPSLFLIEEIIRQAIEVSEALMPLIEEQMTPNQQKTLPDWFPMRDKLIPYTDQILQRINEGIGALSNAILKGVSNLTQNTAVFFVNFFIMVYAIYGFVRNGDSILKSARKYLPISARQFDTLIEEIVDVSKATLKGAIVIGIIQGSLVGLSFWVAGVSGPLFWGTVAAFASLIPGVGAALVYIPGAIYLYATGHVTAAIGVLTWGLLVVGSVDNFLRPVLVGKDMEMSDVMVLVSTLGGIGLFGIAGIILGPLIVGLLQVFINFSYQEGN